ncbi:hypothetical protein C496_02402 [Natronorubrum tibetense GA33]|uniref:Uncharacterized protein n=1 Tax=Natronorubrum tibetense GA33 TaxID=1114856 RepID=L9W912_9EURY|nr:hypothetical protein [Natronorubrum tibetense]ELY45756.1 hypothetical protein C496_02402 [Natronorubrum tibetense GA33]
MISTNSVRIETSVVAKTFNEANSVSPPSSDENVRDEDQRGQRDVVCGGVQRRSSAGVEDAGGSQSRSAQEEDEQRQEPAEEFHSGLESAPAFLPFSYTTV